jgi:hypothetical protein
MAIVAGALSGVFGHGPLSGTVSTSADGSLEVEYERFVRAHAPTTVRVILRAQAGDRHETAVWLGAEVLDFAEIDQVTPQPDAAVLSGHRITMRFGPICERSTQQLVLRLAITRPGRQELTIGLDSNCSDASAVSLSILVYP